MHRCRRSVGEDEEESGAKKTLIDSGLEGVIVTSRIKGGKSKLFYVILAQRRRTPVVDHNIGG
jgi:hypothetical protein